MAKKLFFVFSGTGISAKASRDENEQQPFDANVIRVYFNGCHKKSVVGQSFPFGFISPNLNTVSKKIRQSFNATGALSLSELKKQFGRSIIIEPASVDETIDVEDIMLNGFSRGAVTTFATARYLDDLGIPIRLYAEDPVPGNRRKRTQKHGSEFYKNHDLRPLNNLVQAEVIIGVYRNTFSSLHNRYFRQMIPLFNNNCDASVYRVAKDNHFQVNYIAENHKRDVLKRAGILAANVRYFPISKDRLWFVPKIIQQEHFGHMLGRGKLLPRYKRALMNAMHPSCKINDDMSVAGAQAIYALSFASPFADKRPLTSTVTNNKSHKGKALREFIVEFESIIQYTFQKQDNRLQNVLADFRAWVFQRVYNFTTFLSHDKESFINDIKSEIERLKPLLPKHEFGPFKNLMNVFLQKNILFYPELSEYLDESETFNKSPDIPKRGIVAPASLSLATTAAQIVELLFHMSEKALDKAYNYFPSAFPSLVNTVQELSSILRFLPARHIKAILKQPLIKRLIKDMDDLNHLLENTSSIHQQKAVLNVMAKEMKHLPATYGGLNKLAKMLPAKQWHKRLLTLNLNAIEFDACQNVMFFLSKLDKKTGKKIFSRLEPKLMGDINRIASPTEAKQIKDFLYNKLTHRFSCQIRAENILRHSFFKPVLSYNEPFLSQEIDESTSEQEASLFLK